MEQGERVVLATCNSHCGGACLLKVSVKDGRITHIETDDGEEPQLRACLKGRAYRMRVYAPDRLLYPLKRVGERGAGEFTRISWVEAIDIFADEIIRIRDTYGPAAIFMKSSAGDIVALHGATPFMKILSLLGGFSKHWGFNSFEQGIFAELATFGTLYTRHSRDDLLNARLIILWACDPATTVHDTNTMWYLLRAKEKGTKVIVVDPRFTDTAALLAHRWIPIVPGTDTAVMMAMAYVMIEDNLIDEKFLGTYTVGFDYFRDYVLGKEDGLRKTPDWAEAISSVPRETIVTLAREYATEKPAALICGIAAGRTAYGEQYHRAAMTLAAMTGNIGVSGGSAAGRSWTALGMYPFLKKGSFLPEVTNPLEENPPPFKNFLAQRKKYQRGTGMVSAGKVSDALLKGKEGGYPTDYKMLIIINACYPNQSPDINRAVEALKKMEFIVSLEQFMTPAARWSDLILPTCTFLERNDFTFGESVPYYGIQNKVIEPLGESKSHFDIACLLAKRLGLHAFEGLTEEGVLKAMLRETPIPDIEDFKKKGIYRVELGGPYVAFKKEIEDPHRYPFPTPSGKIEIYSAQIAAMDDPGLPPIPKYIEPWEGRKDELIKKYPLQLITVQCRRRAHTQFETVDWLRETQKQSLQINPLDARRRNIADGDIVRVFNDRGVIQILASVTERIMPGVVAVPAGAWYNPDNRGIDLGGNPNCLLKSEISPGGGFITNTCLVEVEKVEVNKA